MLTKIAAYSAIYIIWGTTYFFIKEAVHTMPPFYVIGLRFIMGGTLLAGVSFALGKFKRPPSLQQVLNSIFIGLLLLVGGNGFITLAERKVDSYLAALFVASVPLVTLICDRILAGKKITPAALIGVILGISGVTLLTLGGEGSISGFSTEMLLVVLGVILWSLGSSMSKLIDLPADSFVNATIQILSVGVITTLILQAEQPFFTVDWETISPKSWGSLFYLVIFGTLGLIAYAWLLKVEPLDRLMSYTFVNPLIAVVLGVLIGNEKPVSTIIPATILILMGLAAMFYGKKIIRLIQATSRRKLKRA